MLRSMVTTVDNPYSPFDNFDAWYVYDVTSGYHTTEFLARIIKSSDQLSFSDEEVALSWAVDEIVRENVLGIYRKVTKEI